MNHDIALTGGSSLEGSKKSCVFRNCRAKGKKRVSIPNIFKMVSLLLVSDLVRTAYVYEVVNFS